MMGKGPGGPGGMMMGKGMRPPVPKAMQPMEAPLTATQLSGMPPAVQKQMIGERLFRQISRYHPDTAAKLTGMMLEMDNSELLMLLESENRLRRQIEQAVEVLRE